MRSIWEAGQGGFGMFVSQELGKLGQGAVSTSWFSQGWEDIWTGDGFKGWWMFAVGERV